MNINQEDIKLIEKFIEIKNKGFYASGEQVTEVYNRVLEKNLPVTNCGSCIRQRVTELEYALDKFKRLSEVSKPQDLTPDKEDENKPIKRGRPKKQ